MTIHPSKHILCAVRSRPGGEETVQRAIKLALESGAKLTFCQIVDTDFVDRFSLRGSSRKAAYQEITEMAEFALAIIRDRAKQAGVVEVDTIIRTGGVRRTLQKLVDELDIDMLVLGRPKKMATRDVFDQKALDAFVAEFEEKGVRVSR